VFVKSRCFTVSLSINRTITMTYQKNNSSTTETQSCPLIHTRLAAGWTVPTRTPCRWRLCQVRGPSVAGRAVERVSTVDRWRAKSEVQSTTVLSLPTHTVTVVSYHDPSNRETAVTRCVQRGRRDLGPRFTPHSLIWLSADYWNIDK